MVVLHAAKEMSTMLHQFVSAHSGNSHNAPDVCHIQHKRKFIARQEWNRAADLALVSGIEEAKIMEIKQTEIDTVGQPALRSYIHLDSKAPCKILRLAG